MVSRCTATNAGGERCQAHPVRPSGFCYWHDPAVADERARKRREGGQNRSYRARLRKAVPEVMTPAELQHFLIAVMKATVAGKVDKGIANAVANLGRTVAGLYGPATWEERLAEIERGEGTA